MIEFRGGTPEDQLTLAAGVDDADLTVSFWVRLNSDTNDFVTMFGCGIDGGELWSIGCDSTGTVLSFFDGAALDKGSTLTVGQWYSIGAKISGRTAGDVKIFLDGVEDISSAVATSPANPTADLLIGEDGAANPLDGDMAAIKVWDTNILASRLANERWTCRAQNRANLIVETPGMESVTRNLAGTDWTSVGTPTIGSGDPPIAWDFVGPIIVPAAAASGRIMSSLAGEGGLAGTGGIAGPGGGLAG